MPLSQEQVKLNKLVCFSYNLKTRKPFPCIICDIRHKPELAYIIPIGGELGWWARFNQLSEYENDG